MREVDAGLCARLGGRRRDLATLSRPTAAPPSPAGPTETRAELWPLGLGPSEATQLLPAAPERRRGPRVSENKPRRAPRFQVCWGRAAAHARPVRPQRQGRVTEGHSEQMILVFKQDHTAEEWKGHPALTVAPGSAGRPGSLMPLHRTAQRPEPRGPGLPSKPWGCPGRAEPTALRPRSSALLTTGLLEPAPWLSERVQGRAACRWVNRDEKPGALAVILESRGKILRKNSEDSG